MDIIIATNNAHKVEEFKRILTPLGFNVFSLKDKNIKIDVEENGTTFEENAIIKAKAIYDIVKLPVIADDSGLCVDALDGAPGIYSARFSGDHDDSANNQKIFDELHAVPDEKRTARFVCNICCVFPNGDEITAQGVCEGKIGYELVGENGFGYDPLFMVGDKSFAELTDAEKDQISHRGNAMREFKQKLEMYLKGNGYDK